MNRKGFELTLNFIIVIILSLVVLGFGINFVYSLFKGGNEYVPQIDALIMDELTRLAVGNKRVAIAPIESQVINRGDSATFGLRIRNTVAGQETFIVKAECVKFGTPDYAPGCPSGSLKLIYERVDFPIRNNAFYDVPIGITVSRTADRGEYLVYVSVCSFTGVAGTCSTSSDLNRYDSLQKIYVTVP